MHIDTKPITWLKNGLSTWINVSSIFDIILSDLLVNSKEICVKICQYDIVLFITWNSVNCFTIYFQAMLSGIFPLRMSIYSC